jgi:hypothetical protein
MSLRHRCRLPFAGTLALCLLLVPAASGASLKPPKWMERPYRYYTLTAQFGVDVEAGEVDTQGGACDPTTTYQSSFKAQGAMGYKLLFGRYRDPQTRKYRLAGVYKRIPYATSANGNASERTTAPQDCAQPQEPNGSCVMSTGLASPELDFATAPHRFLFSLSGVIDLTRENAKCTGDPWTPEHAFGGAGEYDTGIILGEDEIAGTLRFNDTDITRGRRLHADLHPGSHHSGTDNGGVTSWTIDTGFTGGLTLAPGK